VEGGKRRLESAAKGKKGKREAVRSIAISISLFKRGEIKRGKKEKEGKRDEFHACVRAGGSDVRQGGEKKGKGRKMKLLALPFNLFMSLHSSKTSAVPETRRGEGEKKGRSGCSSIPSSLSSVMR